MATTSFHQIARTERILQEVVGCHCRAALQRKGSTFIKTPNFLRTAPRLLAFEASTEQGRRRHVLDGEPESFGRRVKPFVCESVSALVAAAREHFRWRAEIESARVRPLPANLLAGLIDRLIFGRRAGPRW